MDDDYPFSVFRHATVGTVGRVGLFMIALWGGSLVGGYVITGRWFELGLLPVSTLVHGALALMHMWGIVLMGALAWMFYGLIWREAPLPSSLGAVFFLQVASVGLFTPSGLGSDDLSGWALILQLLSTGLGGLLWVLARRRFSPF